MDPGLPKMYQSVAEWFHLLTPPQEYAVEAAFYVETIRDAARIPVESVLELGSGGGNNASHMKSSVALTLVDLSDEMMALSKAINPELEHVVGDMRNLRLGRGFDAVFVHDAVVYMTTENDLRAAIETAFVHCKPGGAALFAPDDTKETFAPKTDHGGDDDGVRGMRYLEWTWDPDPTDDVYIADYAYLLREPDGSIRVESDRHTCAAFPRATWLRLMTEVGFEAERRDGIENETGPDIFVGIKPSSP